MSKPKIAIFHHFFKGDCKGGGEKLILQLRQHLSADLWVGGIDRTQWGRDNAKTDLDFAGQIWDKDFRFEYLHTESTKPIWRQIKRQLAMAFSPKVKELANNYDIIIYSFGNIAFVPQRVKRINPLIKSLAYIHTPPRPFTDQFQTRLQKIPKLLHPAAKVLQKIVLGQFRRSLKAVDITVANAINIQNRTEKYTGFRPQTVIWPAVQTKNFKFIDQQDFYLSHARLESLKRIQLIVEAFATMPDKKLIITSTGPLKDWLINVIKERDLQNITYEGRVSDERRNQLMGQCIAGIYIPVDEDAGITQCEFMAAGKPVIGVQEGGLLETIIDGQTGVLIPANPKVADLMAAVQAMTPELALSLRQNCEQQAESVDEKVFFTKIDKLLVTLE